jgi:hypothetical protein
VVNVLTELFDFQLEFLVFLRNVFVRTANLTLSCRGYRGGLFPSHNFLPSTKKLDASDGTETGTLETDYGQTIVSARPSVNGIIPMARSTSAHSPVFD